MSSPLWIVLFLLAETAAAVENPPVNDIWSAFQAFGPAGVIIFALVVAARWVATRLDQFKDRHFIFMDRTAKVAEDSAKAVTSLAAESHEQTETMKSMRHAIKFQNQLLRQIPDAIAKENKSTMDAIKEIHAKVVEKLDKQP